MSELAPSNIFPSVVACRTIAVGGIRASSRSSQRAQMPWPKQRSTQVMELGGNPISPVSASKIYDTNVISMRRFELTPCGFSRAPCCQALEAQPAHVSLAALASLAPYGDVAGGVRRDWRA